MNETDSGSLSKNCIDSLYRISGLMGESSGITDTLVVVLEEIIRVLGASSGSICLLNNDEMTLEIVASHGLPAGASEVKLKLGHGITGWVALHGKPLLVEDVGKEPRYFPLKQSVRSEIAVPMKEDARTIGVVNIDTESDSAFSEDDLKVLTLLTNEASRVVSHKWLLEELTKQRNQLEGIASTGQQVVAKIDLSEVLANIVDEGCRLMESKACALFLLNPGAESLTLKSFSGLASDSSLDETLLLADSSLGTAVQRRKQIEVFDLPKTEENHFVHVIQEEGLVSLLATPLIFEDRVIGLLNIYTDVSHRFSNMEKQIMNTLANFSSIAIENVRLYGRVFETEEMLRKNDKLTTLGMLSAEIAHEIRNPLTVVKLLFESLSLDWEDASPQSQDAIVIKDKLNHLEEIVERVLNFGKTNLVTSSPCLMNDLIRNTMRLVRLKLEQQNIDLYFEESERLLILVHAGQIEQVLLNLILNATEAMPNGGSIHIFLERVGSSAEVTIADTGTGIPEEIQDRIFESFLSDKAQGTGIGLTIVKQLLKNHRGDIELVRSNLEGTIFRFSLPLADRK